MLTIKQLKNAREFLGLTQGQLAKELGVKLNTVGKWECGASTCDGSAERLVKLLVKNKKVEAKQPA